VDGTFSPGPARVVFDGTDDAGTRLAPGVYLAALMTAQGRATGKFVLLP